MTTVNISLPEDVGALADEQVAAGRFASLSEYVASLIREDRQRLEQLAAESKLRQRVNTGPSIEMTDDHFDHIRQRLEAVDHSSAVAMNKLHVRPGVDDDIFELAEHLIERSEETARRFIDAAQKGLKDAARSPGLGSPKDFGDDPALQGIRSWRIEGFPNHLIFYRLVSDGIDVLAVFHGARDIITWLKRRV